MLSQLKTFTIKKVLLEFNLNPAAEAKSHPSSAQPRGKKTCCPFRFPPSPPMKCNFGLNEWALFVLNEIYLPSLLRCNVNQLTGSSGQPPPPLLSQILVRAQAPLARGPFRGWDGRTQRLGSTQSKHNIGLRTIAPDSDWTLWNLSASPGGWKMNHWQTLVWLRVRWSQGMNSIDPVTEHLAYANNVKFKEGSLWTKHTARNMETSIDGD